MCIANLSTIPHQKFSIHLHLSISENIGINVARQLRNIRKLILVSIYLFHCNFA